MDMGSAMRAVVAGSVLALGATGEVEAQASSLYIDGHLGVTFPVGQFSEYVQVGPTMGVQVGYPLSERLDLLVSWDVDILNPNYDHHTPWMRVFRYGGGVQANLLDAEATSWRVAARATAGLGSFRSRSFYIDGSPGTPPELVNKFHKFSETYFSGSGGLQIGYDTGGRASGYIAGDIHWARVNDEEALLPLRVVKGSPRGGPRTVVPLEPFSSAVTVHITVGFKLVTN